MSGTGSFLLRLNYLAGSLTFYFAGAFIPIGYVFFPAITNQDARRDREGLVNLFLNGSRILALLALPAALMAYAFAEAFFHLWIGAASETGPYASAADLFEILIIAMAASACQRVTIQVYLGTRRMKMIAGLFLVEDGLNLIFSLILIRPLGLFGVVLGTLIPAVTVEWIAFPAFVCCTYGIPLRRYLAAVYVRPVLITAALAPVVHLVLDWYPPTDWLRFLEAALCLGLLVVTALALLRPSFE
jgi:O-antigen/teichoic acid export membrane protein